MVQVKVLGSVRIVEIDGELVGDVDVRGEAETGYILHSKSANADKALFRQRLSGLDFVVDIISFSRRIVVGNGFYGYARLLGPINFPDLGEDAEHGQIKLVLDFRPDLTQWALPFTALAFVDALARIELPDGVSRNDEIHSWDPGELDISFYVTIADDRLTLGECLAKHEASVVALLTDLLERLKDATTHSSVQREFSFPVEVRSACEQYLIFFAEFLRGLGVKATTDIRHEGERTFFSVIPESGEEALEAIRDALNQYLRVPGSELETSKSPSLAEMQLTANVAHLQGQLTLAQATIQMQNATISMQRDHLTLKDVAIAQLHSGSTSPNARGATSKTPEELLGGVVSLGTLETYGVTIDLGEMFRRLRTSLSASEKRPPLAPPSKVVPLLPPPK